MIKCHIVSQCTTESEHNNCKNRNGLHLNILIISKDITWSLDTHLRWMKQKKGIWFNRTVMKTFTLLLILTDAQYLTNKFHAEVHRHFVYLGRYDDFLFLLMSYHQQNVDSVESYVFFFCICKAMYLKSTFSTLLHKILSRLKDICKWIWVTI